MPSNDHDERRHFIRIFFEADARINCASGKFPVHIKDISLKGALIECPEEWSGNIGDSIDLSLQLAADETTGINMQTRLVHAEDRNIGLLCEHIDIDSITNLRRLVELNLGDSDLLERELEALEELS